MHLIRSILFSAIAIGFYAVTGQVLAADLGGLRPSPAPVAKEEGRPIKAWNGCYGEGGVSLASFKDGNDDSTLRRFGIGVGCDVQFSQLIVGAALRRDFGPASTNHFVVRAGLPVNPYLLGYAFGDLEWGSTGFNASDSILHGGLGVETFAIGKHTSIFAEASRSIVRFGDARAVDEATVIRMGVRYRLGGGVIDFLPK